ncbi:stalk domain-containing protein [Paenibacillus farraposensis]|uniref:stalk domain-containing protein n=1 Tax=Paenibacillus farraposensis TaxID=2807095 RepID=UPI003611B1BC
MQPKSDNSGMLLQGVVEAAGQADNATPSTDSIQFTNIVVNEQSLNSKTKPMLINGKLMVLLKYFAEAVGATYHWDVKKACHVKKMGRTRAAQRTIT